MVKASEFQSSRDFTKTATIQVGQTVSEAIDLHGASLVGLDIDANLTGTSIKFQRALALDGTYKDYKANDSAVPPAIKDVEVTVSAGDTFGLNATDFAGVQFMKLVSGAAQAGSDSVITLICRGTPA